MIINFHLCPLIGRIDSKYCSQGGKGPTHGYFDIDEVVVWRTATTDVPLLALALETFFDREARGE
jgi:hypothetical protein